MVLYPGANCPSMCWAPVQHISDLHDMADTIVVMARQFIAPCVTPLRFIVRHKNSADLCVFAAAIAACALTLSQWSIHTASDFIPALGCTYCP